MKRAVIISVLMTFATPALADLATDVVACSKLAGKDNRLDCYDNIAGKLPAPEPNPINAATSPQSLAIATNVKRISAADLAVETHKWEGAVIETSLSCFFADTDEYRCFDGKGLARVRVDFGKFDYAGAAYLRNHCDTLSLADTRPCSVKLRFTYEAFHRQDMGGLAGNMTFIEPRDGYGEIVK
jgi:hypothetical protein